MCLFAKWFAENHEEIHTKQYTSLHHSIAGETHKGEDIFNARRLGELPGNSASNDIRCTCDGIFLLILFAAFVTRLFGIYALVWSETI